MKHGYMAFRHGDELKAVAYVATAETDAEKAKGLSGIRDIPAAYGMLFPGSTSFWMKDTYVDLDIAFLERDRISCILHMPSEGGGHSVTYRPTTVADSAIEMPSGFFAKHGIEVNDTLGDL